MRICILTQPLGANYGGILQAYALQKTLKDMGHEVTTLRFPPEVSWVPSGLRKHLLTARRFVSKYVKGNRDIAFCNPDKQTRFAYKELNRFLDEQMQCLPAKAPLSQQDLPAFDAYIVGSDQVWRPAYSPCLSNFYLDFLGDAPVKRIAYAASFGVDTWEADKAMTARIRPLAQRFDAISVREASGVALCDQYLGVQALVMPDPSLLLPASAYLDLCQPYHQQEAPFIAAYVLDKGEAESRFLHRMSEKTGLPVKYIGLLDWAKSTDALESWLDDIAQAGYVVTNSFHGTVFSILFEKEFIPIINRARGASRFESLLSTMGLQDRLLALEDLEQCGFDFPAIDYKPIRAKLQDIRSKGITFLTDSLSTQI